jgi:hypothetical protein
MSLSAHRQGLVDKDNFHIEKESGSVVACHGPLSVRKHKRRSRPLFLVNVDETENESTAENGLIGFLEKRMVGRPKGVVKETKRMNGSRPI